MRITFHKVLSFIVVFVNFVLIYYSFRLYISYRFYRNQEIGLGVAPTRPTTTRAPLKHISKLVTVVLREFELNENDVTSTVQSFLNIIPNVQILILYDALPYPPLDIFNHSAAASNPNSSSTLTRNVRGVNLSPSLKVPFVDQYPLLQIKTKYVLFVPDSCRISSRQILLTMVNELMKQPEHLVAVAFSSKKDLGCLSVNLRAREWTLKYSLTKGLVCDAVMGKHVIMAETDLLKKLSNPVLLPFPHSLYLQTAALFLKAGNIDVLAAFRGPAGHTKTKRFYEDFYWRLFDFGRVHTVRILRELSFQDGKPLLRSHHAQWKRRQIESDRLKRLYKMYNIKQVVRETGTTEWYGCNRDSPRCFGAVIDSMPSYLFEGRWTPPCCLSNLRKTAKHVFSNLEEAGIRYWLEAGSLLGAMRTGDILPWDHDVDIGFHSGDLPRSPWLDKAKDKPVVDAKGFLWEKATEGNFYRVHYSKVNKIYVNLFPFVVKNGTLMKDSWFTAHKNMEFPDNFLHPMSSIEFMGRPVPSPNNIRDFLELKFGKGAIENPEYPDPSKLPFP